MFRLPKYLIASSTFSGISEIVPWQKVRQFESLGTVSTSRLRAAWLRNTRATPPIGDIGGSSGCRASLTPASSATGTTASRK